MRVILDECLPTVLRHWLAEHEVSTVEYEGWKGTKNGALLDLIAGAGIEAIVTSDRGIAHQQNAARLARIGLIVIEAASNDMDDLLPLVTKVLDALKTIQPGQIVTIGPDQ